MHRRAHQSPPLVLSPKLHQSPPLVTALHLHLRLQTNKNTKRLAPTVTAFDDAKAEADKAGISMADAVRTCVIRGWGGFNASWLSEPSGRVNGHQAEGIFG